MALNIQETDTSENHGSFQEENVSCLKICLIFY